MLDETPHFEFPKVYIAFENSLPLKRDAGPLDFSEIIPEITGSWFIAKSPAATFAFAGYPAFVYVCEKSERTGYLQCQSASTPYTSIHNQQRNLMIDVEQCMEFDDGLQMADRVYPKDGIWEEIEPWERFGPNGRQVLALIKWWREKISREDFAPLEALRECYKKRALLRWSTYPIFPAPKISTAWQPWKKGAALANAWKRAMNLSMHSSLWWLSRYVSGAAPGFVAIALRNQLEPKYFEVLYSEMEAFYPISTLDAETPPVGYKA